MNFLEYFEISATLGIKRLISLLAHSFAPRSHVVGVKHLRSWNVCQHRPFHSLEIKVFTAIITRYRLEYFFEFLCAELLLELIKLPMPENFFIFGFFGSFFYAFSFLKICSSNMVIRSFLAYIFTGRSSFVNLAKSPSSM